MFENVETLNKNKHQNLKYCPLNSYAFARGLSRVPLAHSELVRASRYYPIVFPAEGRPVPQALFDVKDEGNVFVDDNGRWLVPYVPAHIRRYPFILGKTDDKERFVLGIDPRAPHFSQEQGDTLYTQDGEPTELVNRAAEFLKRYQQELMETERLFSVLADKGLLVDKKFDIGRKEQQISVRGFKAVDWDSLKNLDDDTLADWVRQGIMGLIHAHLHSLDNVRRMVG